MNEVREFPSLVHFFTGGHDAFGERSRSTAENPDLTHVAVFLLNELEERGHVGSTKVIDGLQPREHGLLGQALEVILTNILKKQINKQLIQNLLELQYLFWIPELIFS